MTLSAWMIAQDMRRIERDAPHLAALRQARAETRARAPRHVVGSLVEAARRLLAGDARAATPDCCAA